MEELKDFLRKQLDDCQIGKEKAYLECDRAYFSGKVDAYARLFLWFEQHKVEGKVAVPDENITFEDINMY